MKGKLSGLMPSDLFHLYFDDDLSQYQIAKKFGVTVMAIRYWMKKYGFQTKPYNPKKNISSEKLAFLYYHKKLTYQEIADCLGCKSKTTIYKYMKLAGLPARDASACRLGRPSKSSTKFTSKRLKKMWSDGYFSNRESVFDNQQMNDEFQRKRYAGLALKPNKLERKVMALLDSRRWKYSGDGSFRVNGHAPDFVNCNGEKKVILVNGLYWHMKRDGLKRAEAERLESRPYKDFGFEVVFVWEDEIGKWVSSL